MQQDPNRKTALAWWNNLTDPEKMKFYKGYEKWTPATHPNNLTGHEIQNIWAVASTPSEGAENIEQYSFPNDYCQPITEGAVERKEEGATARFHGEIRKDTFMVLLNYIDDMKQRGWEFVKHERTDLSNGNIRIDYELKN